MKRVAVGNPRTSSFVSSIPGNTISVGGPSIAFADETVSATITGTVVDGPTVSLQVVSPSTTYTTLAADVTES